MHSSNTATEQPVLDSLKFHDCIWENVPEINVWNAVVLTGAKKKGWAS